MLEYFMGIFTGAIIAIIALAVFVNPIEYGMKLVASGQYVCVLEPRADKTTEWVCKKVTK